MTRSPKYPIGPDLSTALNELVALMLATHSVQELLHEVARLASGVTAPPASCGISLQQADFPVTVTSSDELAAQLDEVQYAKSDGPCMQAMRTGEVTLVTDFATEQRWDGYPGHALSYGVRSALSLPLNTDGSTPGALNLYVRRPNAFGASERAHAELFSAQAAAALAVVERQSKQTELSAQLREALASRAVIDQAIGILMALRQCNAEGGLAILRQTSQNQNRKLRDVAADLVRSVTGSDPIPPQFNDPS